MLDSVSGFTAAELDGMGVDGIVRKMKTADRIQLFRLDFFKFAETVIMAKRPGARGQYRTAVNAFSDYLGKRELDINDLSRKMLSGFLTWLRTDRSTKAHKSPNLGVSPTKRTRIPNGAESRHMAKLSHIFQKAKELYNDEDSGEIVIPRSPFQGLLMKHPTSRGQRCLGVELMQTVIDARHHLGTVQTALDCFVLSFAMMGANLADLYELATVKKLRPGRIWEYQRRKTRNRRADGAWMQVRVPKEIYGKLWPTLARKFGIEKATVDEGLCHVGDFPITDIYAERDLNNINDANAKVLSMFDWP